MHLKISYGWLIKLNAFGQVGITDGSEEAFLFIKSSYKNR